MSLNLRNPLVIGAVLIGFAGVVVLNVNTFMKPNSARKQARSEIVQRHVPVPAGLVQYAREDLLQNTEKSQQAEAVVLPDLLRDPFSEPGRSTRIIPVQESTNKKSAVRRKKSSPKLHCSAVLLGKDGNTALIQDNAYKVGQKVGGFTIVRIDADGVELENNQGKDLFLSVGVQEDDSSTYSVINRF